MGVLAYCRQTLEVIPIDIALVLSYNALVFNIKRGKTMTTTLTIRLDDELKAEAEELFEDLGLNLTTAITCFFKKAIDVNAIPFAVGKKKRDKHQELVEALAEAKRIAHDPNEPSCTDLSKLDEFLFS